MLRTGSITITYAVATSLAARAGPAAAACHQVGLKCAAGRGPQHARLRCALDGSLQCKMNALLPAERERRGRLLCVHVQPHTLANDPGVFSDWHLVLLDQHTIAAAVCHLSVAMSYM